MLSPKAKAWAAFFVSAVVQAFTQILALGILTGNAVKYVEIGSAVVTALAVTFGVYAVPNGPPAPVPPAAPGV